MASRSVRTPVTAGTRVWRAETMLAESASLKAAEEPASEAPLVREVLTSLTELIRPRAEIIDPSKALTSVSREATSEEMLEMSVRMVLASRTLRGAAAVRVEVRRRMTEVVNCILAINIGVKKLKWYLKLDYIWMMILGAEAESGREAE